MVSWPVLRMASSLLRTTTSPQCLLRIHQHLPAVHARPASLPWSHGPGSTVHSTNWAAILEAVNALTSSRTKLMRAEKTRILAPLTKSEKKTATKRARRVTRRRLNEARQANRDRKLMLKSETKSESKPETKAQGDMVRPPNPSTLKQVKKPSIEGQSRFKAKAMPPRTTNDLAPVVSVSRPRSPQSRRNTNSSNSRPVRQFPSGKFPPPSSMEPPRTIKRVQATEEDSFVSLGVSTLKQDPRPKPAGLWRTTKIVPGTTELQALNKPYDTPYGNVNGPQGLESSSSNGSEHSNVFVRRVTSKSRDPSNSNGAGGNRSPNTGVSAAPLRTRGPHE